MADLRSWRGTALFPTTLALVLALGPLPAGAQTSGEVVAGVYDRYNAGDFREMFALYAEDALFEDPTLGMRVRGSGTLRERFEEAFSYAESWRWDVQWQFSTGEWTVVMGDYASALDGDRLGRPGARPSATSRFVAAFRVKGGKVIHHLDFMEYDAWDEANPDFPVPATRREEPRESLRMRAERYVEGLNMDPPDVDRMVESYADSIRFRDPTFNLATDGIAQMRAGIAQFAIPNRALAPRSRVDETVYSGDFVFLRGWYDQKRSPTAPDTDRVGMRFVTILRIEDGKIYRQWDFFDKDGFDRAMSGRG